MELVAKFWLARLKEGHSIVEAAFSSAWNKGLAAAALHATERGEHHAVFQCSDEPDLLVIMVYHSDGGPDADESRKELNSHFSEFLTHAELFHFNIEVIQLALDSENIAILLSDSQPADVNSGDWSVSLSPAGLDKNHASESSKETWAQIVALEDTDRLSEAGSIKRFSKVLESHIASQSAE
ncbi:hypothetical protein E0Z10_g7054 [Xylaria hypoxylon]|uniref:Uncharacterized protein n=1 Tax=Xylaria hypoxylon TaxID=37992 RepID=A0A4Z0YC10_9PEZI|nr:hypothetical protein E0Z10_g7054 [Xylaria hypoxylon]